MTKEKKYSGKELGLVENALHWKKYYAKLLQPYIHGSVLEIGAGIGGSTAILCNTHCKNWICLEPDKKFQKILEKKIANGTLPKFCEIQGKTLQEMKKKKFDAILYIDVLEHIKDDQMEIQLAVSRLKEKGFLIILAPAYEYLFSSFDAAIGHFRRYSKTSLRKIIPNEFEPIQIKYFDSVGVFMSLVNKWILRQKTPTKKQIIFWDRMIIPLSKIIDRLIGFSFGRSLVTVWKKNSKID